MNTSCSCWHLIKIAKGASMRLGKENSSNSKFCSTQPHVHDSDQRTSLTAHFPPDIFVLPARSCLCWARGPFGAPTPPAALPWWECWQARLLESFRHKQGTSAAHYRFTTALRGRSPTIHIHFMDETRRLNNPPRAGHSRWRSRAQGQVCLAPQPALL